MPPPLPDDLVEEVLLRLPPHEPTGLVRAALVCRRWRRLISDPDFGRRFREFHRNPPMLGMLCNHADISMSRFVPTTAFCSPQADREDWRVLDACHGRVLLCGKGGNLVVWDPSKMRSGSFPFHRGS